MKAYQAAVFILSVAFLFALSAGRACGEELTVVFSGETHGMIYHCACPFEPDGGVARRATLIRQLRQQQPNVLVLDSGGFFAGGRFDEYSQNVDLDRKRSLLQLKAMELMSYDAVVLGDDEFNFGRAFLEENLEKAHLRALSANLRSDHVSPYLIKKIGTLQVGIVGLTPPYAKQKTAEIEVGDPIAGAQAAVNQLTAQGVTCIVLVSHLGEGEDLKLIRAVKGLDVVISGHQRLNEEQSAIIDGTIVVKPNWQGKRLSVLRLTVLNGKISAHTLEHLRLSDQIPDDPEVRSLLPACFSDTQCKQEGRVGTCHSPGTAEASCAFVNATKVPLTVVTSSECAFCQTEAPLRYLRSLFPGLAVTTLTHPDKAALALIKKAGLKSLPAYLLGKEAQLEQGFASLKDKVEQRADMLLIKPEVSGMTYLLERQKIPGRFDVIISLFDAATPAVLDAVQEFKPIVHFLAVEKEGRFEAPQGRREVEEYQRALCLQQSDPAAFWQFISCRSRNADSSWWEDCLGVAEAQAVRTCARSKEAETLLRENIRLNVEFSVMGGPTYVVDNQQIFGTQGRPTKENFAEILGRTGKKEE